MKTKSVQPSTIRPAGLCASLDVPKLSFLGSNQLFRPAVHPPTKRVYKIIANKCVFARVNARTRGGFLSAREVESTRPDGRPLKFSNNKIGENKEKRIL